MDSRWIGIAGASRGRCGRAFRIGASALALLCVAATAASAQNWPNRPLKLVVAFAAGGSTDATARLLAQKLTERLGQPVVVENRPGAGGNIGSESVAKAEADGYTLIMATSTTHATNPSLYKNLPFDPIRDFAPVSLTAYIPNVLVVNPSVPANDLGAFVAFVKSNPGKVNYGSAGSGSSQHLAGALFATMAGAPMTHVPYRGGAPAMNDLLGGHVQAVFAPLVEALAHIQSGKLKALGVTTLRRSPLLPEVPTIGESIAGYEVTLWNGILAPAGTPAPVLAKLHAEIVAALASDDVKAQLATQGSEPVGSSPQEFAAFLRAEGPKWAKLVEISGAKVD